VLILKFKLYGRSKIKAIDTWVIIVVRYGAGIFKWNLEEMQGLDMKAR